MITLVSIIFGFIVVALLIVCVAMGIMAAIVLLATFLAPFVWLVEVFRNVNNTES